MSGWRLTVLCVAFYLFACLFAGITLITSGSAALPVSVSLSGSTKEKLASIDVYKVSITGNAKLLTTKTYIRPDSLVIKDEIENRYFQGIQVKLSEQQSSLLSTVSVNIGSQSFLFTPSELTAKWRLIGQSSDQKLYQSPAYVSAQRSVLPFWKQVVNWDLNSKLIWAIFFNKFPLLLILLTFLGCRTTVGRQLIAKNQHWIHQTGNWPIYATIGIAILITAYRVPYVIHPIGSGLDLSWIVGLNWAANKGLEWGKDIVFTYGPYYWLLYPDLILNQAVLLTSLLVTTLVFTYAVGVLLYYLFRQTQQQKLPIVLALSMVLILALSEYSFLDLVIISAILLLAMSDQSFAYKTVIPACILFSLLSLCKFSYLAISLCAILFFLGKCLVKRRYEICLLTCLLFISGMCALWILSGQPLTNLLLFITRSYETAQGYPEAMATPFWNETLSVQSNILVTMSLLGVGVILLAGIVSLLLKAVWNNTIWFELLLTSPVLFLAFKEGFIRMDPAHAALFFAQLQVVLVAYAVFYSRLKIVPSYVRVVLITLFAILMVFTDAHAPFEYSAELKGIFSLDTKNKFLADSKNDLQKIYSLKKDFNNYTKSSSVDIMPYDVSLLYGYNLNWSPRATFQSYVVYTTVLDSLNAAYFARKDAPQQVFYSFRSIDNHYPLFEEPAVFRQLLNQYRVVDTITNTYLLLNRLNRPSSTLSVKVQPVSNQHLNTSITIPHLNGYYTYLYAKIELTLLGKLLNFILKIQPLYIDITTTENLQPQRFRFIRQTAKDGLLVSSFAGNFQTATTVLSGTAKPNVATIKIIGNSWLYDSQIKCIFRFEAYAK